MVDLTKIPTEQLLQLQAKRKRDLSGYSTEELMARRRKPWSDLPGNIAPSAKAVGENIAHAVTHPAETVRGISDVAQGAADRLLPEAATNFLDRNLSFAGRERTPEEKRRAHEASGQYGQQIMDRWGSFEKARNTLITDPVGGALEIGSVVSPLAKTAAKVVTPLPAPPHLRSAGRTLRREGVDLTAGQRTGNRTLQYGESELGGARGQAMMDAQAEQFTRAALRRVGVDANRATPQVMDQILRRFNQEYGGLAARNNIYPDPRLFNDLTNAVTDYQNFLPSGAQGGAQIVYNYARDIHQLATRGGRNGPAFQKLRSRLTDDAKRATDDATRGALQDLREALDQGMERSIARTNPQDLGAWRDVNRRYRNFIVIEDAVTRAGGDAGIISPAQLAAATKLHHGRRNYGRGQSDFSGLAHAGQTAMKPLPQSGTAPRAVWHGAGALLGGLAGGTRAGANLGGPASGAAIGAVVGPALVGRALMSPPVQAYLGNQIAAIGPRLRRGLNVTSGAAAPPAILNAEERRRRRMIKQLER